MARHYFILKTEYMYNKVINCSIYRFFYSEMPHSMKRCFSRQFFLSLEELDLKKPHSSMFVNSYKCCTERKVCVCEGRERGREGGGKREGIKRERREREKEIV